jgi:hypothetical protein
MKKKLDFWMPPEFAKSLAEVSHRRMMSMSDLRRAGSNREIGDG